MIKMSTIFETVHGSHLYGLAHSGSDYDFYGVVANRTGCGNRRRPIQRIVDGFDYTEIELSTFLTQCDNSVHQALEAMFSRKASPTVFENYRKTFKINMNSFREVYGRTIRNFSRLGVSDDRSKSFLEVFSREGLSRSEKESNNRRVNEKERVKYRRHAIRLLLNFEEGASTGRFDPTLSDVDKIFVKDVASLNYTQFVSVVSGRLSRAGLLS